MAIEIYDDTIAERVIPEQVQRPNFRIVVPTPFSNVGDCIEVIVKINGVEVPDTVMKYTVENGPEEGHDLIATVSMGITSQPSAPLPPISKQIENQRVAMSPEVRIAKAAEIEEER